MKTLLHNAQIINRGKRFTGWVLVDGEFIEAVGEGRPAKEILNGVEDIDLQGAMLIPGAIDTHVHFREPGLTHKATIASESAAAVAGGVTSFLEMPNTRPATVTMEAMEQKQQIAARSSLANYAFFIGATNSNIPELLKMDYTHIPGIKLFMGSSTGNMLVDDDSVIAQLFSQFKGIIAVHAEDEATIRAARELIIAQNGEDALVTMHHILRSAEACYKATERAVELARRNNTRLHVLHISTARELKLFTPGKVTEKHITAETCPHYLLWDQSMLAQGEGYLKKCNPAIKSAEDGLELLHAVVDGRIDTIATDHAPHQLSEKQGSLFKAASGMPGIKFMLPAMMTLASDESAVNKLTPELVVEKCCHNPALLYGIVRRGFVEPGMYADLTVIRPCAPYAVSHLDALSHLPEGYSAGPDWTPYAGMALNHRVALTMVNGTIVYNGDKIIPTHNAHLLNFSR